MAIVPGASLTAGRRGAPSKPSATAKAATPTPGAVKEPAAASGGDETRKPAEERDSPAVSSLSSPSPTRQPSKQYSSSSSSSSPSPAPAFLLMGARSWTEDIADKKKGKYSNAESKIVVDAVKAYAAAFSVSVEDLCQEGGRLKRAWPSIANCLPDRPVESIYKHGLRKLKGLKRGPWSLAEVKTLEALVAKHGQRWSVVEQDMGRPADACRDKFREIIPAAQYGVWTKKEEKALNDVMMARLNLEGESPLTLTGEEKAVNVQWLEVSKLVKTRNRIACMMKWAYSQANRRKRYKPETYQRTKPQHLEDPTAGGAAGNESKASKASKASNDLAFVEALVSTGAADESEVNWNSLSFTYPRASLRWKTLRGGRKKQSPYSHMGFQETAQAVVADLRQQVASEKNTMNTSPKRTSTSASILPNPPGQASSGPVEENEQSRQEKLGGHAKDKAKKKKKKRARRKEQEESEPKGDEEKHEKNRKSRGGDQGEESGGTDEDDKTKKKKKNKKQKKRERAEEEEESDPKDKEEVGMAKKKKKKKRNHLGGQEEEEEKITEKDENDKDKRAKKRKREGQGDVSGGTDAQRENKKRKKKRRSPEEEEEEESERPDEEKANRKKKRTEGQDDENDRKDEEEESKKKKKKKKKQQQQGERQEDESRRKDEEKDKPKIKKKGKRRRREEWEMRTLPPADRPLQHQTPPPAIAATGASSASSSSKSKKKKKKNKLSPAVVAAFDDELA